MPNKQEKRSKEKRNAKQSKNRKYGTLTKNQFKKIEVYLKEKKPDEKELKSLISETQKILDTAKSKKVIHRNNSANKKSKWIKKLNLLSKKGEEVNQIKK
jgi:ribosomal protein S20